MIGDIIASCFFGMSSVVAVETAEGYDLRIHNARTNSPQVESCVMDLGDATVQVLWVSQFEELPDTINVAVSPGWQSSVPALVVPENNEQLGHIFVVPLVMG